MRVAGPRDELPSFAVPRPWRALLWRSFVRGAACGLLLALAFLPVGLLLELRRGTLRAEPILACAVFAAVVGLLGTGPAAAVEAWARQRPGRTALAAVACGALVAGACLVVLAQVIYLRGVVHGGPEAGLDRVGRLISSAASDPNKVAGGALGAFLALGVPFGVAVALRLRGFGLVAQAALGAVVSGGLGVALVVAVGVAVAVGGGDFERVVTVPVVGALVAVTGFAGFGVLFVGTPLAALTPFALRVADRLAPLPAPAEGEA